MNQRLGRQNASLKICFYLEKFPIALIRQFCECPNEGGSSQVEIIFAADTINALWIHRPLPDKIAMIEFVYFDLGKVILDFSHEQAFRQMSDVSGVPVEDVSRLLFEEGLQARYETGLLSSEEFVAEFGKATGSAPDSQRLLNALSDIFDLNQAMLPIISGLSQAGIPIGILSNTCQAHWEFVVREYPVLTGPFSEAVLSFEVQSMKPDLKIYQAAIEQAGTEPNRIFFMDDKPENVDGAIEAGIHAVQFQSASELTRQLAEIGLRLNV